MTFYQLPQDILTNVYDFDDTYRRIFQRDVMGEIKTKMDKCINMFAIESMKRWSEQCYPYSVPEIRMNMEFCDWYFVMMKYYTKASKQIVNTNVIVSCLPVSISGTSLVPYDHSCTYHSDDDDSSYTTSDISSDEDSFISEEEESSHEDAL